MRKIYKRKIDMHKVRLMTNDEPCTYIGADFFQSMPQKGEVIYYNYKDYYIHTLRHFSDITYLWVEDVTKKPEEKINNFTELVEKIDKNKDNKSFIDKIKEKYKSHLFFIR